MHTDRTVAVRVRLFRELVSFSGSRQDPLCGVCVCVCVQFTILKELPKKKKTWQTGRDVIQLVTEFIDTLTHLASVVNS